jgi:hypothetical protein
MKMAWSKVCKEKWERISSVFGIDIYTKKKHVVESEKFGNVLMQEWIGGPVSLHYTKKQIADVAKMMSKAPEMYKKLQELFLLLIKIDDLLCDKNKTISDINYKLLNEGYSLRLFLRSIRDD